MRRLGDVIAPASGRAGSGHSLPVYSVTKHAGFVPQRDYFKKQVASVDTSSYKVVRAGQFAYATIHLDEGAIGFAPEDCIVSPMYTVFSVDSEKVDITYLSRLLRSPQAIARYGSLGRGSAERRKSISLKALGSLLVPIPDLQKQRRIAAILDAADTIRAKRRAQLVHLDELRSAAFERALAGASYGGLSTLGHHVDLITGPFGSAVHRRDYVDGGVPLINPTHMVNGRLSPSRSVAVAAAKAADLRAFALREGDAVLARRGEMGRAAVVTNVDLPALCGTGSMIVRPRGDSRLGPLIARYLSSAPVRQQLEKSASGITMLNVNQDAVRALPFPEDADRLAVNVASVDEAIHAERARVARALEADDELFAALQHRAFRGEL